MKKNYLPGSLFSLLLISLLFTFCHKKEDETPAPPEPEPEYALLAQEQIGPEGGTLTSDEVTITIPQGAFSKTADISLYSKKLLSGHPLAEDALSGLFQLEGIPSDFSKPIAVKIKGKATGDNSYLAIGLPGFPSGDSALMTYFLAETSTDGEYLAAELTPFTSSGKSSGSLKDAASDLILEMILNSGYQIYVTYNKLITIAYPSNVPFSSVHTLAKYINNAHTKAKTMGFRTHRKYLVWVGKEWRTPIDVIFFSNIPEWLRQQPLVKAHLFPGYSFLKGYVNFNMTGYIDFIYYYTDALINPDLLQLEQSAYRVVFFGAGKLSSNDSYHTYNKYFASDLAGWGQEFISLNTGFKQPLYFDDYIGYSLNVLADRKMHFLQSGYSPQLKYVYDHFSTNSGNNLMVNIFNKLFINEKSGALLLAISKTIDEQVQVWYPDFMEKFLNGDIYTFDYSKLANYISDTYTIKDSPFSGENGERLFFWLETRLYRFNIDQVDLSENDTLIASVEHLLDYSGQVIRQDVKLMAYIYDNNGTTISHIATSYGDITIPNLKQYQNNESILLAVCYAPPIYPSNQIQLSFKIKGGNHKPDLPFNPNPADNATGQSKNTDISWECTDPDNDPLTFDVYFGSENPPPVAVSNQSEFTFSPGTLMENTQYFWKIIARDDHGNETEGPVWSFTTKEGSSEVEMVQVNGGVFELNGVDVTISSFKISKYEITNDNFIEFLNDIGCDANGSFDDPTYGYVEYIDMNHLSCPIDHNGSSFYFGGSSSATTSDCPVIMVTWYGANAYCQWAGGRLPTDAEWEVAARGATAGQSTGTYMDQWAGTNIEEQVTNYAWYISNCIETNPVGTKTANELGLHDMCGNVAEWCSDWYDYTFPYSDNNPTGPPTPTGWGRVMRNGGWYSSVSELFVGIRKPSGPYYSYAFVGFRLLLP